MKLLNPLIIKGLKESKKISLKYRHKFYKSYTINKIPLIQYINFYAIYKFILILYIMYKTIKDLKQYNNDVKYGATNEEIAYQHIRNFFVDYLEDENIVLHKFKRRDSIFDFKIKGHNILIELKSRRNTIDKYPTQLIGHNKIVRGRDAIKKTKTDIFFFYLLENDEGGKSLYHFYDEGELQLKIKYCGNFRRGDKASKLCLIPNDYLTFVCSF